MTYLETLIAKTTKQVKRWHGYNARMFELTRSHTKLKIMVTGKSRGQNLMIACIGPEFITGPIEWSESELMIETTALRSGKTGIAAIDKKNGVRVTAESFEIAENVKE